MKIINKKAKNLENENINSKFSEDLFDKKNYKGYIVEEYNTIYEIDYDEYVRKHEKDKK